MTDSDKIPWRRRRSTLVRFVAAILVLVLALLVSYALWTVDENTLTPAAVDLSSRINTRLSSPGDLSPTAARALKAYGGEAVWKGATTVDVQSPHTVIKPVDDSGDIGVLDGFSVMIVAADGRIVEQRADAREHLQNASLSTKWDRLNLLYFLGYAFWGYYTFPQQLMRTDIEWTELRDGVLQAHYGTGLPVHSRIQRFWFDTKTGLLRRNDYTPVAADPNARVANIVFEHGVSNGIPYTSKRRVKTSLQQYGWVLPAPHFNTIDVEKWSLR